MLYYVLDMFDSCYPTFITDEDGDTMSFSTLKEAQDEADNIQSCHILTLDGGIREHPLK